MVKNNAIYFFSETNGLINHLRVSVLKHICPFKEPPQQYTGSIGEGSKGCSPLPISQILST